MPAESKKIVEALPADFDGIFRFTNFTDSEFVAKWDGIEYTFPANKTIPLLIPNATPEQVQYIRKKFARDLAILVFYNSDKFKKMDINVPGGRPALYTESDLAPITQRCLEPLPIAQAKTKKLPKDSEDNYKKDEEGKPRSRVIGGGPNDPKVSLRSADSERVA